MFNWFRASVKSSFLALGIIAATLTPIVISIPASAQNTAHQQVRQHQVLRHQVLQHQLLQHKQQQACLMWVQITGRVHLFKP